MLSLPHTFSKRSRDAFISTEVNQRVESTVQTHQAPTELTSDVDTVRPFLAQLPTVQKSRPKVEVLEYVVGDVTDREQKHQDDQQLHTFLFEYLVGGICPAENDKHVSVAAQRDEERDAESCERPSKTVPEVTLYVHFIGGVEAFFSVPPSHFGVEHVWKTLNPNQQPGGDRDNHRAGESDLSQRSQWMDNSQVPVDTYTGQEADAAVQIQIEEESRYLAERLSKNPSTLHEVVHHQKGNRQQVQDV